MRKIGWRPIAVAIGLMSLAGGGCKQDLPCYGADECEGEQICFRGACIDPPEPVLVDVGFPVDAGFDGSIEGQFSWLRDIEPLVRFRCQSCHSDPPTNDAPFPLVTYADTQALTDDGALVHRRMAVRMADPDNPMPPPSEPRPSQREIDIVVAWSALDAPLGSLPDSSLPDTGPIVDAGPDVGFPDTGFFDGGPNGASDPILQIGFETQLPGAYVALDGLVWSSGNQTLYFCDVGSNVIFEYSPEVGAIGPFRANSEGASDIGIDPLGRIVVAQQGLRRLVRENNGEFEAIANDYNNDRFNSPADIEVRSDGTIYFTDPPAGLVGRRELPFNGVFRLTTTGTVVLEWAGGPDTSLPQGLALSPDEQRMYMLDAFRGIVRVFDVESDGDLTNERGFTVTALLPSGIGMTTDREGNLYVATAIGVEVFAPSGFRWGVLPGAAPATNVAFGGPDLNTLFVAAGDRLFAYPAGVGGAQRPLGGARAGPGAGGPGADAGLGFRDGGR